MAVTEGEKKLRGALTRLGFENADDVVDALKSLPVAVFIDHGKIWDVTESKWIDDTGEYGEFTVYTETGTPGV